MKTYKEFISEATKIPFNKKALQSKFERLFANKFLDKEIPVQKMINVLESFSKEYLYEVSWRGTPQLDYGDISIWGFYAPETDQEYVEEDGGDYPIELIVLVNDKQKTFAHTRESVQEFAFMVSETLSHEWTHLVQARKRNWLKIKPKNKYKYEIKNKEAWDYLANDDEIEAHAGNIAGSMLRHFGSYQKSMEFLRRPSVKEVPEHHFDMYLNTFGSSKHPVIKRLFKKIAYFLGKQK